MATVMMAYPVHDGFQGYQQQYAMYQTRAHQPQVEVAQSLHVNPYANYQPEKHAQQYFQQQQQHQQPQSRSPQPATSIMTEDGLRPSLPSISNLLGIADGERGSQDQGSQQQQLQAQTQPQVPTQAQPPIQSQPQPQPQTQQPQQIPYQQPPEQRQQQQPQQQMYPPQDYPPQHRTAIPPTPPPLRNDSVVDPTQSPSTISTGSSLSIPQPYYLGTSLNNVEASDQRPAAAPSLQYFKRPSVLSQPTTSPFGTYTNTPPYIHSPATISTAGSYYSSPSDPYPSPHHHQPGAAGAGGLYTQRPLPSNFPPPQHPPGAASGGRNIWEHHHYISPTTSTLFPPPQDRYICPTCAKAFSRPSSLKIHSNSHTGEKPYRCPHAGCGKAFSVRSNMKRHQRGCHVEGAR